MTAVLELDAAGKVYPGPPEVTALVDVDLAIEPGELAAVVGPSGSGKSTLLNLMGALDRPTGGTVRVDGADLSTLSDGELSGLRSHRIGFVFQDVYLIEGLDATANVAEALIYRGVPRRQRLAAAAETLARVGLGHRLDHRPDQLSGGERQRVAIARALVGEPGIVFADEPTGNLDTTTSGEIADLLVELNAAGATIVVITHDTELASRFPRIVTLRDGRVVSDGSTSA